MTHAELAELKKNRLTEIQWWRLGRTVKRGVSGMKLPHNGYYQSATSLYFLKTETRKNTQGAKKFLEDLQKRYRETAKVNLIFSRVCGDVSNACS